MSVLWGTGPNMVTKENLKCVLGGGNVGDTWEGECCVDITTGPEKELEAGELGKRVARKISEDEVTREQKLDA